DRTLQPDRREWNPELLEELRLRHRRDLVRRPSLDEIAEHRRGGLADRAAAAVESDLLDDVTLAESHRHRHLVAAERVLTLRPRVRRIEQPVVPRVLVVVQDELPVELVALVHGSPRRLLA